MSKNILSAYKDQYVETKAEIFTIDQYLELARTDKLAYAFPAERWLAAVGDPEIVNTANDQRLARIFGNRLLRRYKPFADFFGIEDVIEEIVNYFRHNAQGLEESKQLLYLLGPVGSSKSSLAERIKELIEVHPIYVLAAEVEGVLTPSPYFGRPLNLFNSPRMLKHLQTEYGIDPRYAKGVIGPWEAKRLREFDGDITKFKVMKMYPSRMNQIAIANAEPGDPNTQDVSTLTGKVDIRKLEEYAQNDPDAYLFSAGLNKSNQGILDFREMFKAPIKMLNPLLFAVQEHNYEGTENFGAIPYDGIVVSHCFSEDTELLTENGWKKHDEIAIGDLLATMNLKTSKLEYQPALNKFFAPHNGEMVHFASNSMDHLVTKNHKMVYHTQYTSDWKKCLAGEYGSTGKIIPVSAENTLPDYDISDDMLRLMVWTIADGSLTQNGSIRWHLAKPRKIERLSNLLSRMEIVHTTTVTNYETASGMITRNIQIAPVPGVSKDVPEFYNKLSARQCRIFLDEYSHTDGSRNDSTGKTTYDTDDVITHYQLSTNNQDHIDKLQHMAFAAGYKANQCEAEYDDGRYTSQKFLSIRVGVTETRTDYAARSAHYEGNVFCFETANHTLVARRNGKVIVTGNSNESEWSTFKNNKSNEAFLDRVLLVKVPYCLRIDEEVAVYDKYLSGSELKNAVCAPGTKELLAKFAVMTRINEPNTSNINSKARVYNGDFMKSIDSNAKSYMEYREDPDNRTEGFSGFSTRSSFKLLSQTFNADPSEIAADPVHLMYLLQQQIKKAGLPSELEEKWSNFITTHLKPKYEELLDREIRTAFLEAYGEFGQNLFDRYVLWAGHWIDDMELFDAETGVRMDKGMLDAELSKIEKPNMISNPKDYRSEVVRYCLRYARDNQGRNPDWRSYERLKETIEKKMFTQTEDLLPVISYQPHASEEDKKKHGDFISRMVERGYTAKQVRFLVEWYLKNSKSVSVKS